MRNSRHLLPTALIVVLFSFVIGCGDDSPTDPDSSPVISNLRVNGALRITGNVGLAFLQLDYMDPDADIVRFVFRLEDIASTGTTLTDVAQTSGTLQVQQAVTLPDPGSEVSFAVWVVDAENNESNSLNGSFIAP